MFSLPQAQGSRPEGDTEDNSIVLQGIHSVDFDRFLSILYPINFLQTDLRTVEEWTSVLLISSIWDFSSLRTLAADKLTHLTCPVDRIVLAKQFDLSDRNWLAPAYFELCTRSEPLTMDEGRRLGIEAVIKVGLVRHQIRHVTNLNRHEDTITALVKDMFWRG